MEKNMTAPGHRPVFLCTSTPRKECHCRHINFILKINNDCKYKMSVMIEVDRTAPKHLRTACGSMVGVNRLQLTFPSCTFSCALPLSWWSPRSACSVQNIPQTLHLVQQGTWWWCGRPEDNERAEFTRMLVLMDKSWTYRPSITGTHGVRDNRAGCNSLCSRCLRPSVPGCNKLYRTLKLSRSQPLSPSGRSASGKTLENTSYIY